MLVTACVESRGLPEPIEQARIDYGPRIYLADETRLLPPGGAFLDWCTRLATRPTGTTTTSTSTQGPLLTAERAGVMPTDGKGDMTTLDKPYNCFVEVEPRSLRVDVVEVTNELFQLCADSGACKGLDPSKANKGQLCDTAAAFDRCPVLEVSQTQAAAFCDWVGRRLPNGFEHVALRQANASSTQDPAVLPAFPRGGDADEPPVSCEEAVLRSASCLTPRPVAPGAETVGAASMDTVAAKDGKKIYDLTGNASEWSADLFATQREGRPWFCEAPLSATGATFSASNPPLCPEGARCVYGTYQPSLDLPLTEYPVCVTAEAGRFTGTTGALFGGSYRDQITTRETIGVFGRRVENDPISLPDSQAAREYGFRCVGDRTAGDFDDMFELRR